VGTPWHLRFSPLEVCPRHAAGSNAVTARSILTFLVQTTSLTIKRPLRNGNHWFDSRSREGSQSGACASAVGHGALDHGIIGSDLVKIAQGGEVETGAVEQLGGTVRQHGHHTDVHHL
jgi:hypothetical protein